MKSLYSLYLSTLLIGSTMQAESNSDAINKRCYDHKADYWDRFPYPEALPDFVMRYHPKSLGNKVLDVGSGTGVLAEWLKKQGYDVFCIDPSEEMVKRCKGKGLATHLTTLQAYQQNDQKFAMVFAILSMIHVPKPEWPEQIDKLANMIPPNGLLFLGIIEGDSEGIEEMHSDYPRFFVHYERKEVPKLFDEQFDLLDFWASNNRPSYLLYVFRKR